MLVGFTGTFTADSPAARLLGHLALDFQVVVLPCPSGWTTEEWAQQMTEVWAALGDTVADSHQPAILYDRYVPQAALLARLLRIPAGALCTDLPNRVDLRVPPVNSGIVPGSSLSSARLLLAWSALLYASRRQARTASARLPVQEAFATSMSQLADRYGVQLGRPPAPVSLPPYPLPRPPDADEFVFTSTAFDFRRTRVRGIHRLGLLIESRRPPTDFAWGELDSGRKLVYCAFGTERLEGGTHDQAFDVVAEAASELPGHQVVLATGSSAIPRDLPDNVVHCREAPQLQLIQRAALVISHGGFNTVKEAAAAGVPSLVLPVSGPVTDAKRTGALVEYLGLGRVLPHELLRVGPLVDAIRGLPSSAPACQAFARADRQATGTDPAVTVLSRMR
ncbi:glycosyltransferase [Kribbella sp. VKM Ac-2571]|uniref:glycosyltransferase n=1 Tax=Kribbella sp. VKM Ac-2571 TaxID=2512222 RepID=UPI001EDD2675|nr:glycosyltransferase [Kribbella sp. VKM Ac-2571]